MGKILKNGEDFSNTDNLSDYVFLIDNSTDETVTISANGSISVSNYIDRPSTPSGYKRLLWGAYATGNASVIACAPFNSSYVLNTSSSSRSVTLHYFCLFIRDI